MESTISVTIGIPTYNRLSCLKEAVASALAQTYPNIEILISQNPHRDRRIREEIAEYCQGVAARDPRIRYELRPHNLGQTGNYQWLVDSAQNDYIFLIGDDDHVLPNGIESLVSALAPYVVVAFGRYLIIDDDGRMRPHRVPPVNPDVAQYEVAAGLLDVAEYEVPAGRLANPELWAWRRAMAIEKSLIRTRDFRRVRFRDSDIPDLGFFIFLAREGGEFVFVPEYVAEHRVHPDRSCARVFKDSRLVFDDLEPLPVRAEIEPYKRKLLEMFAFDGISKCLLAGELAQARRLLASGYYPPGMHLSLPGYRGTHRTRPKGLIMKLCAGLPGKLGPGAYNFLYAMKHGRRYRPATI